VIPIAPRKPRVRRRPGPGEADVVASLTPDVEPPRSNPLARELAGIVLLIFAVFLAGALIFEHAATDRGCTAATGPFGPVGGCVRWGLLGLLGIAGSMVVPFIPLAHSLRLFGKLQARTDRSWLVFTTGLALLLPIATGLARGVTPSTGLLDPVSGLWGGFVGYYIESAIGAAGAWCAVALLFSVLTAITLEWNPVRSLVHFRSSRRASGSVNSGGAVLEPAADEMPAVDFSLMTDDAVLADDELPDEAAPDDAPIELEQRRKKRTKKERAAAHDNKVVAEIEGSGAHAENDDELPPLSLLDEGRPPDNEQNRKELEDNGKRLLDALRTFRVDGELTGWTQGPTVTQYEIAPAPGVKVRQIANLANDIALAMRAQSIRIVAPIPGKGAVGVEVPNPTREMVATRDLLESREYQTVPRALPIALGKDLEGRAVIGDLAKMPHLLIAGATGSGKSVCVNTIITSLIYRHTPETLRFLMVDPKMVELSVYNTLPHLRHKVVTDNRDAAAVLKWAVMEMQQRYKLLAENGARNIQDFNAKLRGGAALRNPKASDVAFEVSAYTGGVLPYIVVVIDELADLMMTVQAEVETPLAMLAQKARAIGIHLLLATQRPSVNVITGLIKANFPSRIAFRVASQVDSRTIIDGIGAEALLGNGDMLFIPPGKSDLSRLQGAFLSNEETERVLGWYNARREAKRAKDLFPAEAAVEADILEQVRAAEAAEAGAGEGEGEEDIGDRDKLFRDAAEVCIQHQGGSTSLLQRRLKVGYGRAARIIDQLHFAGILGPPDGSKPRDVLKGLQDLDGV
jgi:S-DNA-T family DNA segregation ATPase FtsK/SpoIIIE